MTQCCSPYRNYFRDTGDERMTPGLLSAATITAASRGIASRGDTAAMRQHIGKGSILENMFSHPLSCLLGLLEIQHPSH